MVTVGFKAIIIIIIGCHCFKVVVMVTVILQKKHIIHVELAFLMGNEVHGIS